MSRRHATRLGALLATAGLTLALPAPAALAHDDRARIETMLRTYSPDVEVAVNTSGNVSHLRNVPGQVGISGCFMQTEELLVTSGLESVRVYDVSRPTEPVQVGMIGNALFENEAMTCGERRTEAGVRRFVLIGVDLVQASPADPQHVNAGGNELVVVDVTDPTDPRITSRAPATTSTHTVACVVDTDCRYAYSAGDSGSDSFSIFDLRKVNAPKELDAEPGKAGVQPFRSPTPGHKWNFDEAGYGIHTGFDGSAIFDVGRPRHPRLVTTTGKAGRGEHPDHPGYNDFIHHNSQRPNAEAFKPTARASVRNGNVLFVTEEDYEQTDCSKAGSFQSWKVKRLDGRPAQVVPLDKVELTDIFELAPPQYAFCSAHWFDHHPAGIVAVGFYGGGMQLVDARNPRDLTGYGHAFWGASEVWDSYWVPKYGKAGRMTDQKTSLVYSIDLIRGLDVYRVDLPGRPRLDQATRLGSIEGAAALGLLSVVLVSVALRRRVRT
jgi:hypothetical protein